VNLSLIFSTGETAVMIEISIRVCGRAARVAAAALAITAGSAGLASAQTAAPPDPNPGAITFTGGLDVPSKYVFRGLVQEADSKLTLFPYGDIGIALFSGDGGVKSAAVNFGVWNSLNTGTSGLDGLNNKLHYEEDFYATLTLGFARGVSLATTYTAYTSPNDSFGTVQEIAFKVAKTHFVNPYGLIAFELDGQADGGSNEGTYAEFGVAPAWPIAGGKATVSVPAKIGLSLSDYYEGLDGDEKFGYFQVGGLISAPLTSATSKFGAWTIKGGVDVYAFGETPKAFNNGDRGKVVATFGIGVVY
jgi:hypothetical protein